MALVVVHCTVESQCTLSINHTRIRCGYRCWREPSHSNELVITLNCADCSSLGCTTQEHRTCACTRDGPPENCLLQLPTVRTLAQTATHAPPSGPPWPRLRTRGTSPAQLLILNESFTNYATPASPCLPHRQPHNASGGLDLSSHRHDPSSHRHTSLAVAAVARLPTSRPTTHARQPRRQ